MTDRKLDVLEFELNELCEHGMTVYCLEDVIHKFKDKTQSSNCVGRAKVFICNSEDDSLHEVRKVSFYDGSFIIYFKQK